MMRKPIALQLPIIVPEEPPSRPNQTYKTFQTKSTEIQLLKTTEEHKEEKQPASKVLLKSAKQELKPFDFGSSKFFRIGKPFSAAYF